MVPVLPLIVYFSLRHRVIGRFLAASEVGFAALGRDAYAEALAGYASGTAPGVAGWLVHCCRAAEHGAAEGLAICESLLRG